MKKFVSVFTMLACLVALYASSAVFPAAAEDTVDPGTDENTVIISNAEELLQFAQNIADGKGVEVYGGKTVSITADIDLNPGWDEASDEAPSVTWPVASDKFVQSLVIEGNNHTISGLYALCPDVTSGATTYGFFGCAAQGGTGVSVQNLSVVNSKMVLPYLETGCIATGGLFGGAVGGSVTLNNLFVDIDIAPSSHTRTGNEDTWGVGGLIGFVRQSNDDSIPEAKVSVTNCVVVSDINPGDIWCIGGFIGRSEADSIIEITDSAFYGNLGGRHSVGGFLGRMHAARYTLTRCVFGGSISATDMSSCGGLVVSIQYNTTPTYTFTDCIITSDFTKVPDNATGYSVVEYADLVNVPDGWDAYGWHQPEQDALMIPNELAIPIIVYDEEEDPWGSDEEEEVVPSTRDQADQETDAPQTTVGDVTDTPVDTDDATGDNEGGCASVMGGVAVVAVCAVGAGVAVSRKKKEE